MVPESQGHIGWDVIIILLHAISQKTTFPINSLSFQGAEKIIYIKFAISKEVQAIFGNPLFQFILHKCLKCVSLIKTSFASRFFELQNFTFPSLDFGVWSVKSGEGSLFLPDTLFLWSAHPSIRTGRTRTVEVICFMNYYKCCDNWRFCINLLSYKIKKKKRDVVIVVRRFRNSEITSSISNSIIL